MWLWFSCFKSGLHWVLLVHLWQRGLTLKLDFRVICMAENHLVMDVAVQQILSRKEAIGVAYLMCCIVLLHHHHPHGLYKESLYTNQYHH